MKKRILSLLLVGTMTLSLLTGCGYGGKETKAIINLDNLKKADEQIEAIIDSDEFKEADEEKRLELAIETIDKLIEAKVIEEKSVQVVEEKGVVTFIYEGGGAGAIQTTELAPQTTEEAQIPSESKVESTIIAEEEKAEQAGATVVSPGEEIPEVEDIDAEWSKQQDPTPDVVITPTSGMLSIRVYNAFEDNDYRNANYETLLSAWKEGGFTADQITLDNEVYVEELLDIPNYTMVSFSMHGSVCRNNQGEILPIIILLDDHVSEKRDEELQEYIGQYEVVKMYTEKGACYGVFPSFFSNNFSANALSHTIVYSESCKFFGSCNNTAQCDKKANKFCNTGSAVFAETLCSLGCPAVLGFHNSVYANYALGGLYVFGLALNMGYTPEFAFCAFTSEMGETDRVNTATGYTAFPLLFGKNITCTIGDLLAKKQEDEKQTGGSTESDAEATVRLEHPEKLTTADGSVIEPGRDGTYAYYLIAAGNNYEGYNAGDIMSAIFVIYNFESGDGNYTSEYASTRYGIDEYVNDINGQYWVEYCKENFDISALTYTDITDAWIAKNGPEFTVYTKPDDGIGLYEHKANVENVCIYGWYDAETMQLYGFEVFVSSSEVRAGELIDSDFTYEDTP